MPYWGPHAQRRDPATCNCQQCSTLPPLTFHTQTWHIAIPLQVPHICPSSPPSSPLRLPIFGWLLNQKHCLGAPKATMYFFKYIFVDHLNGQNDGAVTPRTFHPSRTSSPIYNPPWMPTSNLWSTATTLVMPGGRALHWPLSKVSFGYVM